MSESKHCTERVKVVTAIDEFTLESPPGSKERHIETDATAAIASASFLKGMLSSPELLSDATSVTTIGHVDSSSPGPIYSGNETDESKEAAESSLARMKDMVDEAKWSNLQQYILSNPNHASLQDDKDRTALHHLCACITQCASSENRSNASKPNQTSTLQSPAVVDEVVKTAELLISICPASCWAPDDFGWTPLSLACSSNASESLIELLISVHPAPITMQTHCGMTPIYLAVWSSCSLAILQRLLRIGPNLVMWPTIVDETPLTLLWGEIRNVVCSHVSLGDTESYEDGWKRIELLLEAAFHQSLLKTSDGDASVTDSCADGNSLRRCNGFKFRAVFAACGLSIPSDLVKEVLRKYPSQVWETDEFGRTPMVLACTTPCFYPSKAKDEKPNPDRPNQVVSASASNENVNLPAAQPNSIDHDETYDEGTEDEYDDETSDSDNDDEIYGRGTFPIENEINSSQSSLVQSDKELSIIDSLLLANPTLCQKRDTISGRLPLMLALESGKEWNDGIGGLVRAHPDSVSYRDEASGLYPFMIAACLETQQIRHTSQLERLDTLFRLLCANPQVIKSE